MLFKRLALFGLAISFFVFPLATRAESTPNIESLLKQIQELQTKINELRQQQASLLVGRAEEIKEFYKNLQEGSAGDDVKSLQALLAEDREIYPEGLITGYFGPKTAVAVKRFQTKHGLEAVGSVGPKTIKKLNEKVRQKKGSSFYDDFNKKPKINDATAPVISNLLISQITNTSATITWQTDEPTVGKVHYGTTPTNYTEANVPSPTIENTLSQSMTLTNLAPGTTYYFSVKSKDKAGNTSTSAQQSFNTNQ